MQTLQFKISVGAPVRDVYRIMLDKDDYRKWSSEFNPTSYYEGSWKKGDKILFIGLNSEGKREGMVSKIKENIPEKFVSIEHLGLIDGDKEITDGPEVREWAGAKENYSFEEQGQSTTIVTVDLDVTFNDEFKAYFEDAWPRALRKLKEICERKS